MNQLEAAFFYGDFTDLRSLITELLSENMEAMWVQQELFT